MKKLLNKKFCTLPTNCYPKTPEANPFDELRKTMEGFRSKKLAPDLKMSEADAKVFREELQNTTRTMPSMEPNLSSFGEEWDQIRKLLESFR